MNSFTYKDDNLVAHIQYGKMHREDGPAKIIYANGEIVELEWYQSGILHRADGPARMWIQDRKVEYWLNGKYIMSGNLDQQTFDSYIKE